MLIGMLWFNNDSTMAEPAKIAAAVKYYLNKYGIAADLVYVHPAQGVPAGDLNLGSTCVTIKHSRSVMPNHYWIGRLNGKVPDEK